MDKYTIRIRSMHFGNVENIANFLLKESEMYQKARL